MESINFEKFINLVTSYNKDEVSIVTLAYEYAMEHHKNQYRESGEEYISHPLAVAYTLAEMHADKNTLCASLLHDVLEDTNATTYEINELFGSEVLTLVDGVTKIRKMNFDSKEEENDANMRKILEAMQKDIRIIIIKLADRLHNMRTLQYKTIKKQKENSMETLSIYAPLAYLIGAYRIESELEDLSLQYLKPDTYKEINDKIEIIRPEYMNTLNEAADTIGHSLTVNGLLPFEIKKRMKNIYGIYRKLEKYKKITNIHDLISLKIMMPEKLDCYVCLGLIHELYHPINSKFKDYISNPKTNKYSSLHSTIYSSDGKLIQTQIRTFDMDKIASFGLLSYWDINKEKAKEAMHSDLDSDFQFFKTLKQLYELSQTNKEFVDLVKKEVLCETIYVYDDIGEVYSLPKDATIVDYACKKDKELANHLIGAMVNDEYVTVDCVLNNKDRIILFTKDNTNISKQEWDNISNTALAKSMIKK